MGGSGSGRKHSDSGLQRETTPEEAAALAGSYLEHGVELPGWDRGLTVGRIVHYFGQTNTDGWAAVVTRVRGGGEVDLFVMPPAGATGYGVTRVPWSDVGVARWSWPARV